MTDLIFSVVMTDRQTQILMITSRMHVNVLNNCEPGCRFSQSRGFYIITSSDVTSHMTHLMKMMLSVKCLITN